MEARDVGVTLARGEAYPCAVVPSRHQGTYEGGPWLAFPLDPWDLPLAAFGDDVQCPRWWSDNDGQPVGRGDSPQSAYEDMFRRLDALPRDDVPENWQGIEASWTVRWADLPRRR